MDRSMARDRPSPYGEGTGIVSPRLFGNPSHGEGQADGAHRDQEVSPTGETESFLQRTYQKYVCCPP